MSELTTDDCKEFLVEEFPDTLKKDWKRVSKYKNNLEFIVREFKHTTKGSVFLMEDLDDELEILESGSPDIEKFSGGLKPKDYIFTVLVQDGEPWACITRLSYWLKNGFVNDQPDYYPLKFFPKEWEAEDVNEGGTWVFQVDMTPDELKEALLKIGFSRSDEFDEFLNDV